MKKLIISAGIIVLFITGCNNSKTDEKAAAVTDSAQGLLSKTGKQQPAITDCKKMDMNKYKKFTKEEVGVMADDYRNLVWKYYEDATQQVTLTPDLMRNIACNAKTIKLISTAEGENVSMTMEYATNDDNVIYYYDLQDIFGKGALCPPPNNCGITDTMRNPGDLKKVIDSLCKEYDMSGFKEIPEEEVKKMAENYENALKGDYKDLIQQITLDPELLYALLCSVDGFKLIAAADDKKEITMIIEYTRDGKTAYYDIKQIFGSNALCPPPNDCGIPYGGMIKKNATRPKQK